MKLDLSNAPEWIKDGQSPKPGDIYRKKGGPFGYWWIISITAGGDAYILSFDRDGNINGTMRYSTAFFTRNENQRVGFAEVQQPKPEWFATET